MEHLVRPTALETWKSAQKIHGISPDDVAGAPTFESLEQDLINSISNKTVAIFNAPFDLRFIPKQVAQEAKEFICVMQLFRKVNKGRYRLQDAMEWANYTEHQTHRAIGDALATLHVWKTIEIHLDGFFQKAVKKSRCIPFKRHFD